MAYRAAEVSAALQGRYAIERELGRGGMATVYLAEDRKLHRRVALKLLHPDLGSTLGPERFLREIAVASRLTHPNILALHDSGEAGGRLFYAMPFVDGESLRERLRREPQFPIDEMVRIVRAIAGALDHAHREGVIHRDIKPENILLARDPAGGPSHPLLADFGIARALDAAGGERLTATGVALGTPSYMSPEQAAGERVDGRSDIYALGCVAYEMLAGAPPFTGPTAQAILARHAVDPVPALRTVRSTVPPAIVHAIERALAKVPADRFATATEFADALVAQRSHWRERVRASRLRAAGLLAGAAVVLGLGAVVMRRPVGPIAHGVMPSAGVIAVLPFRSPRGDTALTRLGRDLATTVSASLDGVGGVRTADRLSIASASVSRAPGSPDAEAGLARRLGAGRMLLGTLVPTGKKVRLDLGLYAVEGRGSLAPGITITAYRDSLAVMTDSIVWTLLRQIWRRGPPPSPSLDAVTTHSIPALRAFLDGELAVERSHWDEAALAYRSAIAADSSFWLAYFRYAVALEWSSQVADSAILETVRAHRRSLPELEGLLADAYLTSPDSISLMLRRYEEVTRRFPDYWPGWFFYGDLLYHYGPTVGRDWWEGRQAFRRVVALNPNMVDAWSHLFNLAAGRDQAEAERSMKRLTELGRIRELEPGLQIHMQLVLTLGRTDGVPTPEFRAVVDSQVRLAINAQLMEARPGFLQGPQLGLIWLGFPRAQLEYNQRALRLGGRSPDFVSAYHAADAWAWAARGQWDSALVVMNKVASIRPGALVGGSPLFAVENYGLAVLGAWLGVTTPADADRRRPAAVALIEGLPSAEDRPEPRGRVAWLDGLLAFRRADRQGIARARIAAGRSGSVQSERIDRSLAAFGRALAGDRGGAGRDLADLVESCAEHASCDTFTPSMTVQRLAAAQWLVEAGDKQRGARLLRWQDAIPSGPQWVSTTDYALAGPAYLARARLEESAGDPRRAREYYQQFLRWYDEPMSSQAHLVEEARAALARLGTDR